MMLQKLNTKKTEALVKVKAEAAKQLEEQVAVAKNEGVTLLLAKEKEKAQLLARKSQGEKQIFYEARKSQGKKQIFFLKSQQGKKQIFFLKSLFFFV